MNEYKVLARKYRPQTFSDLVGQEVLVRTLSNAINANRLAHAFILTGIRGIGKTTTARIMAKALNCIGENGDLDSPTINPCGVCSQCVQIRDDRHIDVMEVDAASNTGVDDMRQIIETSLYKPTSGRYKVYIIDEVHMLSKNSFNAMLKTLEEPPANVVFILATTELRKIPVTILSRCQRFDLKRLTTQEMATHLQNIAQIENVNIETQAIDLIAIASEGSVRDALSLLDQAISHSDKDNESKFQVKAELLRNLLGLVDRTRMYQLLQYVFAGEADKLLLEVQKYYDAGADMVQLVEDVMHAIHDITRILIIDNYNFDSSYSQSEKDFLHKMAKQANLASTTIIWQILSKGLNEVRFAVDLLRSTEMLFVRICYASNMPDPDSLIKLLQDKNNNFEAKNQTLSNDSSNNSSDNNSLKSEFAKPVLVKNNKQQQADIIEIENKNEVFGNKISSFNDIISLCENEREMILLHNLRENVRFIKCDNNILTVNDASIISKECQSKLLNLLQQYTGSKWRIEFSKQSGQATIFEQAEIHKLEELNLAKSHPIVKEVLDNFNKAQLVSVEAI